MILLNENLTCFRVKNAFNYSTSSLYGIAGCGKDLFYHSQVWNPDNGNGTYTNPVIYADYSDPDVVAVGDDYYLTASSFNCIPGLPILHSKDLVNWEIIGYALQEQEPKEVFDQPQHGKGVWAPSIRYHNGEFYIYWGDPDHGIFMVKTKDPRGEWEKPVCVLAALRTGVLIP